MKARMLLAGLALGLVPLAGCDDGYRSQVAVGWESYPYQGWYDGFYGPIYDGYWGHDDVFYYRSGPRDHAFRRDDRHHFRRGEGPSPGPGFRRFEGTLVPPPHGTRMPRFQPPAARRHH